MANIVCCCCCCCKDTWKTSDQWLETRNTRRCGVDCVLLTLYASLICHNEKSMNTIWKLRQRLKGKRQIHTRDGLLNLAEEDLRVVSIKQTWSSKTPLLRPPLSLRKSVFIVGWSYYWVKIKMKSMKCDFNMLVLILVGLKAGFYCTQHTQFIIKKNQYDEISSFLCWLIF